ncbi:MAG: Ig-like domain-containing protein, partial [Leptospiraceae bacterium]|nr:Ig-like domain-containing protein [Leptospiraceae bacterium]
QPGNTYVMKVSGSARSQDGVNMSVEYIVHFYAGSRTDAPQVTGSNPANNAQGISVNAGITIFFSRAMDRNSVESAFNISPSVAGAFNWDPSDKSVTFQPYSPLNYATTYSVTVSVGAKDQEGITIPTTFNTSFQVGSDFTKPTIVQVIESGSITPITNGYAGVYKDSNFIITFSEPMDFSSAQSAFSLTRLDNSSSVAGSYQWNATFDQLTFVPDSALEPEHPYRLKVTTGAEDQANNGLDQQYTYDFTVNNTAGAVNSIYMTVVSLDKTSPVPVQAFFLDDVNLSAINVTGAGGATGGPAVIEIDFSHSLDPNSVAENFSLSRTIGLDPPLTPVIGAVSVQNGSGTNSKLVIGVQQLGVNEYKLTVFGGRNGILSAVSGGETGTWLADDLNFYFSVSP